MPFGSVLSEFEEINLETADGVEFKMKNSPFLKLALKTIGIPHIEMRARARIILSYFPKEGKNKKLLDAGCGPGIYSLTLKKRGFDVYAIDIDKNKIDFLKKNAKDIRISKADVTNLLFKDNFFDYIICSEVIEHIKKDKKAIKELIRVLKPKGILVLTTPKVSVKNVNTYRKWGHFRPGYDGLNFHLMAIEHNLFIQKIDVYSSKIMSKMFEMNEKLYRNKILLGLLFYPLYSIGLFGDLIKYGEFNGIAVKFEKK